MKIKFVPLFLGLIISARSFAQTHVNEVGIKSDNDSFLAQGSDRYYTNGIFIYYRHALKVKDQDTAKLKNKVLGFELGHKIYNAQSGRIPNEEYVDRPFAGYLYAGINLNLLYANESNLKLGAQVGVIGPGSGGYEIQKFIHNTFGFYQLNGWQYQIHDGAQLNLSAEYNRLLTRGNGVDLSFNGYGNLGNGFTGAGAGLMLRLGDFNQLFSSVSTQSTATRVDDSKLLHKREFFAYYKPALNYVAYDATIQGSLFNSHSPAEITMDQKPIVISNQIGVAYTASHWVFDLSIIFRSKEAQYTVRSQQWGSLTALYRF